MDNQPGIVREMALFAGAGGGILGGHLLGWKTVCAVEWEPYPASVLVARQNDGILPPFPIWDDVQTFDGKPWRGLVDVVSGGFPCQDISSARSNNNINGSIQGIAGSKSSMWKHMARIVDEVRPRFVHVENSEHLVSRGLALVVSDFAAMGYGCKWGVFYAANYGAEHVRPRLFLLADANMPQRKRRGVSSRIYQEYSNTRHSRWGKDKPGVDRTSNAAPARMDRLKAIGNAQVPIVAATAFNILRDR
jgi:DNA (cytosine-5)-methyltransferase 1